MWPKLYSRWMMLHKYILNLDSWKNTVCYEDWQLCLVISFSTKNSGRYQQNWNLQNTASLVDASLWHLKYFIVNILTGCRYRINCQEKQYRRAILWKLLCQFLNICGLMNCSFVKKSTVSILLRQISVISILGVRIVYGNFDTYCFLRTSIVSKRM